MTLSGASDTRGATYPCPVCRGQGMVPSGIKGYVPTGSGYKRVMVPCPSCSGTGRRAR
jgi:DnaJ-class molecular chaperone